MFFHRSHLELLRTKKKRETKHPVSLVKNVSTKPATRTMFYLLWLAASQRKRVSLLVWCKWLLGCDYLCLLARRSEPWYQLFHPPSHAQGAQASLESDGKTRVFCKASTLGITTTAVWIPIRSALQEEENNSARDKNTCNYCFTSTKLSSDNPIPKQSELQHRWQGFVFFLLLNTIPLPFQYLSLQSTMSCFKLLTQLCTPPVCYLQLFCCTTRCSTFSAHPRTSTPSSNLVREDFCCLLPIRGILAKMLRFGSSAPAEGGWNNNSTSAIRK